MANQGDELPGDGYCAATVGELPTPQSGTLSGRALLGWPIFIIATGNDGQYQRLCALLFAVSSIWHKTLTLRHQCRPRGPAAQPCSDASLRRNLPPGPKIGASGSLRSNRGVPAGAINDYGRRCLPTPPVQARGLALDNGRV